MGVPVFCNHFWIILAIVFGILGDSLLEFLVDHFCHLLEKGLVLFGGSLLSI